MSLPAYTIARGIRSLRVTTTVESYFKTFVRIYDEHFFRQERFWQPIWRRLFTGIWIAAICTKTLPS